MLKNVETAEGLREHADKIIELFRDQPMHEIVKLHVPRGVYKALKKAGINATPWAIKQLLKEMDYEREREVVAPAFYEADIETVYYAACVTWHYAWSQMTRYKASGATRRIDADEELQAGDFVKIDRIDPASADRAAAMSWILRIERIEDKVAKVDVLEKRDVPDDCSYIRESLHLDCLYDKRVRTLLGLRAERMRRPGEKGGSPRQDPEKVAADNVAA